MFYMIELENDTFLVDHEIMGICFEESRDLATIFNEYALKSILDERLKNGKLDTDSGLFGIKKIHCLDVVNELSLEETLERLK